MPVPLLQYDGGNIRVVKTHNMIVLIPRRLISGTFNIRSISENKCHSARFENQAPIY